MPRTALTAQALTRAGITPNYQAADSGNGNTFPNNGSTLLHVKNTGVQSTLTIKANGLQIGGSTLTDLTVTIPATTGDKMIGPFDPTYFNQAGNVVNIDWTSSAGVTVAVIQD